MKYFAHSGSPESDLDWQLLSDHLSGVSSLAAQAAAPLGFKRAAALAGVLHDLGKYTPGFQRRLRGGASVDHSTAGGKIALDRTTGNDRVMAELVAYAILGHHAGLPDSFNDTGSCLQRRIDEFEDWPDAAWETEITGEFDGLMPEGFTWGPPSKGAFKLSVLGRMLFSCLVDADYKETEAFYNRLRGEKTDRIWPPLAERLPDLRSRFDAHMAGMRADDEVNALRGHVLRHVLGKADEKPGFFTMTVPTGGGKTLASLGFALDHAAVHGKRRIIYAIPFTSIIDQTAQVFRSVLGEDIVLEHHSAIDEDVLDARGATARRDKMRLAMEDWAAPVVVTTSVQLFESLFADRPSRARKLHNIAHSVIVLDEAQTLPRGLLMPVLRMLEELVENYGCTIVLCTATQPALGRRDKFDGLDLEGRELAPDPEGLSVKLRRAHIRSVGDMDNAALVSTLAGEDQALFIVNSRKHAFELFKDARATGMEDVFHLSTRQCAAHRQARLGEIRHRLKEEEPCRVISTSLVEAGVDIDFPRVWRARAGLDQIVQAAGRCNREGRRKLEESVVSVFEAPDYPPPREIASLIADADRALDPGDDALSPQTMEAYFREVYWRLGERLDKQVAIGRNADNVARMLDCFKMTNGSVRTQFAYRSVAEGFRMIESGMEPVIIAWDEIAQKAVDNLNVAKIPSCVLARALQRYIVQVPPKARQRLLECDHVRFASPELRGNQFAVLTNRSLYDPEAGLVWEDAEYLAQEVQFL